MTIVVEPTNGNGARDVNSAALATAIQNGLADWVVPDDTDIQASRDPRLSAGPLNGFAYNIGGSSGLTAQFNTGEAFVGGSYLASDDTTIQTDAGEVVHEATLPQTATTTVYLGHDHTRTDYLIIGPDSAFPNTSNPRIPIYDVTTDATSITATNDLRPLNSWQIQQNLTLDLFQAELNVGGLKTGPHRLSLGRDPAQQNNKLQLVNRTIPGNWTVENDDGIVYWRWDLDPAGETTAFQDFRMKEEFTAEKGGTLAGDVNAQQNSITNRVEEPSVGRPNTPTIGQTIWRTDVDPQRRETYTASGWRASTPGGQDITWSWPLTTMDPEQSAQLMDNVPGGYRLHITNSTISARNSSAVNIRITIHDAADDSQLYIHNGDVDGKTIERGVETPMISIDGNVNLRLRLHNKGTTKRDISGRVLGRLSPIDQTA